jgi:general secretion pathway protein G
MKFEIRNSKFEGLGTRKNQGFTLLEIMMVVMIIALLAGAAIYKMAPSLGFAQETRAKNDIQSYTTELKMYQATNGFLPTTEQGLDALVTKPSTEPVPTQWRQWMDKLLVDPWQNPYVYECPGKHNPNSFDLYSCGPHGKTGPEEEKIGNWDK